MGGVFPVHVGSTPWVRGLWMTQSFRGALARPPQPPVQRAPTSTIGGGAQLEARGLEGRWRAHLNHRGGAQFDACGLEGRWRAHLNHRGGAQLDGCGFEGR
ncbi:hypothetical protein INN71_16070 [Nocardioides sp. ChNu-153]|uniref:hypothetical protein n=1 Tax=unclassified Nocardioides TaxID=2615069 RepID=UPI002405F071|nr:MULTISPECIES: hypothetical protein [unclassified Nocardioides]MDF9716395.1 hypothetical protein [Nocardioides sp. ChNu-99]MDN7122901.1 hypothetical protein [Nocardioides sp. ChNu-153]